MPTSPTDIPPCTSRRSHNQAKVVLPFTARLSSRRAFFHAFAIASDDDDDDDTVPAVPWIRSRYACKDAEAGCQGAQVAQRAQTPED